MGVSHSSSVDWDNNERSDANYKDTNTHGSHDVAFMDCRDKAASPQEVCKT